MAPCPREPVHVAGLCAALAGAALLIGDPLQAVGSVSLGMAVVIGGATDRRPEAERQAAFARRPSAARREPQAVVVVRRPWSAGRATTMTVPADGSSTVQT